MSLRMRHNATSKLAPYDKLRMTEANTMPGFLAALDGATATLHKAHPHLTRDEVEGVLMADASIYGTYRKLAQRPAPSAVKVFRSDPTKTEVIMSKARRMVADGGAPDLDTAMTEIMKDVSLYKWAYSEN